MANFLLEAYGPWMLQPPEHTDIEKELQIVADTIQDQYGVNLRDALGRGEIGSVILKKINFEELLALADETDNAELRRALERVVYKTLERSLEPVIDHGRPDREYEKLIKRLVKTGEDVCMISFNYDLLLDRALTDAARADRLNWSYGMTFLAGINFPSYKDVENPKIHLLKLHGSLNWLQCENCGHVRLYQFMKYDDIHRTTWPPCRFCSGNQFKPMLVAPTPVKLIPDALQKAWETATKCLRIASDLIVIGYSFPVVDRRVRNLFLREYVVPNLSSFHRPKLTLVDRSNPARDAIKSWLLPAVDTTVDEYCTFEEFCTSLSE
jgi:NAD-dependent SIR2 family protein deacetylase